MYNPAARRVPPRTASPMMPPASDAQPPAATMTAVTFDVDWAPDWTVELCAGMCATAGVPATFFATHRSPVLAALRGTGLFELGIHPNFLPGSSHGDTHRRVLDTCLEIVPEAVSLRSHSLVQATPIFECIAEHYPQLRVDASLLLYGCGDLRAFEQPFGASARRLVRVPYGWEDDVAAIDATWRWGEEPVARPGLNVYAFHPIHVALNSSTLAAYRGLRAATAGVAYGTLDAATIGAHAQGGGTRDFLGRLLAQRGTREFRTIAGIALRPHRTPTSGA